MDPRFAASPADDEIARAIALWPELAGKRLRPLLVSAFGEIFLETADGTVISVDPVGLTCEQVAGSAAELERLFADRDWAEQRLLVEVALLASERGVTRLAEQVFAIAPHPSFSGAVRVEHLVPMDLSVWHGICAQIRGS